MRVGCAESVHCETTGKTSDRSEKRFKGFGKVMRNEVFVHLRHGNNGLLRVGDRCLSAYTDDLLVMHHTVVSKIHTRIEYSRRDKSIQGQLLNRGIRIDHE